MKIIKIGITQHPHIGVPQDLKGGDEVVNSLIKEVLEDSGYLVEYILYDCSRINSLLKHASRAPVLYRIIKKCARIFIPILYSRYLNRIASNYDLMICDSTVLLNGRPDKIINYFHGTYYGYRKRVGKTAFGLSEDIAHRILSCFQKHGARRTYNLVVSDYVRKDLDELGIRTDKVIYNCVDTELFKPAVDKKDRKGCLYAGGYAYYGKGFDILDKLASKGLEITCVTNDSHGGLLKYMDTVPHEKMPEIYNKYMILLYPSRSEACQMVPLEAMSCGLPVIISNVGFAPELKKIIPEFVVDGYDSNAVNEYLRKINHILDHYDEYSNKAREYILTKHSHDRFKDEWKRLVIEFNSRRKHEG